MPTEYELLERLEQHTGVFIKNNAIVLQNKLHCYCYDIKRKGTTLDLSEIFDDMIDILNQFNTLHNVPPKIFSERTIPYSVTYYVSYIIDKCLTTSYELRSENKEIDAAEKLVRIAWLFNAAWDAYVAGDIEDLKVHVSEKLRYTFNYTGLKWYQPSFVPYIPSQNNSNLPITYHIDYNNT